MPLFCKVKDAKDNSAKEIQKPKLREAIFIATTKLSRPCCGSKTGQNTKKNLLILHVVALKCPN